jgi:2-alkyl-3-oxoalkanoate reductase
MLALVTGATGFIGSHVIELLRNEGWQVRGLVRRRPRSDRPWPKNEDWLRANQRNAQDQTLCEVPVPLFQQGIEAAFGDVRDLDSLRPALDGVDVVFHLAANVTDWGHWRDFEATTVEGTRNLLRAAAEAKIGRFVHFSTVSVYDDRFARRNRVLTEDTPHDPPGDRNFGHYARSKALAEQLVWDFHRRGELAGTVLRPALVYGPRDESILPRLIDYLRSPLATYIGRGNPVIDPIEVTDVARCALAAATCDRAIGRAFNVAPPDEIGVRDFYRSLCRALDIAPPRFTLPYTAVAALTVLVENAARLMHTRQPPTLTWAGLSLFTEDRHHDPSLAERDLGWRATVSLDAGLARYAEWLKSPDDQPRENDRLGTTGPRNAQLRHEKFAQC